MTYTKRHEVLEAAANWMRVCEAAGVRALGKHNGVTHDLAHMGFDCRPDGYEFPLALLEGKEVWVGSELYVVYEKACGYGEKVVAHANLDFSRCSWNPPNPKTVMVELDLDIVEHTARLRPDISPALTQACKKALESLK